MNQYRSRPVRIVSLLVGACLGAGFLTVLAGEQAGAAPKLLPGYAAKENIDQVNKGIKWHTNLAAAESDARQQGKMILWIHLVGKMDGAT
ncbi:MAG: hypothetical protein AB7W16_23160 [Candidatus Obscuribacterales bacterium]